MGKMEGVDLLYAKNVMVKYVLSRGRVGPDAAALLPVLATLLQARAPREGRRESAEAGRECCDAANRLESPRHLLLRAAEL